MDYFLPNYNIRIYLKSFCSWLSLNQKMFLFQFQKLKTDIPTEIYETTLLFVNIFKKKLSEK